jgi:3-oxoacyl-[acyl-carrier-protein] synthase III
MLVFDKSNDNMIKKFIMRLNMAQQQQCCLFMMRAQLRNFISLELPLALSEALNEQSLKNREITKKLSRMYIIKECI